MTVPAPCESLSHSSVTFSSASSHRNGSELPRMKISTTRATCRTVREPGGSGNHGQMKMGTATGRGVDIAYERLPGTGGEPLLLIMGLGMQMIFWPDDLCAALADRGFAVARF